jgi:hypothetical protein
MSGLHLDGQVEASFDTFATASDQLDIDRLAELLAAVGITRMVLVGLRHHALDDVDALARPAGAASAPQLRAQSGYPRGSSCAGTGTDCGWCSISTIRTSRGLWT